MDLFYQIMDTAIKAAIQMDNYRLGRNNTDFSAVHGLAKILEDNAIEPPYDTTERSTKASLQFIVMMSHFFEEHYNKEIKVLEQLSREMKTLQAELYLVPHQSQSKLEELTDVCVELSKRGSREYRKSDYRYY
ncbi:MAG: hypothetical protein Q8R37_04825 [Nanoarchaeota archaeon]|nr:hypothetical protein [Nanoarchaeota archaeon]